MTVNAYYLNTLVRVKASFTDASTGLAADPTTVTLTVTDPKGTVSTPPAVKDSTGNYHADLTPTVWGDWSYAFAGSGAVVASGQHRFFIEPPSGV